MAEHFSKFVGQRLAAWFPERKLLILGQDQVTTLTLSHRAQVTAAAALAVLCLWSAGSLAVLSAPRSPGAGQAPALQAALAQSQARIAALNVDYAKLAASRDQAASQTLAQAEQIRDAAIVQAAAARAALSDAAARAAASAAQSSRLLADNGTALVNQLAARTSATINQVDRIIRATGLDPAQLAAQGVQVNAGPGASLEAGAVGRLLDQPGVTPAEQQAAAQLLQDNGRLQALAAAFQQIPLIPPLSRIAISSPFGYRASPFTGAREFHVGVDLTGPVGTPVYATAPGVVVFAGVSTGYGNLIIIDHGYGLSTRYSHLERFLAPVGTVVALHQEIALLGNTGWSTGPHLLYETRVDGAPRNPLNFMEVSSSNVQN